jgi:hypothetical protein
MRYCYQNDYWVELITGFVRIGRYTLLPSPEDVLQFIEARCQALELSDIHISDKENYSGRNDTRVSTHTHTHTKKK